MRFDPQLQFFVPVENQRLPSPRLDGVAALLVLGFVVTLLGFGVILHRFPRSAETIPTCDDYADPVIVQPQMLRVLTTPRPLASPTPAAVQTLARINKLPAQPPAPRVRKVTMHLPPLDRYGLPNVSAPDDEWSETGRFRTEANCERFRKRLVSDTVSDRDQGPESDRALYNRRIRLIMAARCEG